MRIKTKSTNPSLRKIDALCRIERYGDALKRLDALDLRRLKPIDVEAALAMDMECTRALGIPFHLSDRWRAALGGSPRRSPRMAAAAHG